MYSRSIFHTVHGPCEPGYRERRRRTLNFEALGKEAASDADLWARVVGRASRSRRYRVIQPKEKVMSDFESRAGRDRAVPSFRHQRDERFEARGELSVHVATRSGDVTVLAGKATELAVRLGTDRSASAEAPGRARVEYDAARGTLLVETLPRAGRGLRGMTFSDWRERDDVNVVLVLPLGSDLQVTTVSGDTRLEAALGEVEVSSVSGDVQASDELSSLDVRTASGDVSTGTVRERLRCRVASGDVMIAGAAARTDVASASGDVAVTALSPSDLSVNAASGDVRVSVLEGLAIDVAGRTVSGHLESRIDLDGLDEAASRSDQLSMIRVTTVSGDILIDRVTS